MRFARCSLALVLLAAVAAQAVVAQSQAGSEAQPPLPQDPGKLMLLAAQQNGLEGPGMHPWYIHATWQIDAWQNQPAMQGAFEEWWSGPENYQAVYSAPGFRQALVVTPHGSSTSGNAQFPDPVLRLIDPLLGSPLPSAAAMQSIHFTNENGKDKKVKLRCAGAASADPRRPSLAGTDLWQISDYCFVGDLPAIRMEAAPNLKVVFNSVVQFQGRYLAESIQIARKGLPTLEVHVDDVHTMEAIPAAPPREKPLEPRPARR